MTLSYSGSCLIGALMESVFYGLYFILFLRCLEILRQRHIEGKLSVYLLGTTLVLFVLITMRLALDNKAAVEAFTNDPTTPNAAEIYFTSFGNGSLMRTGTYITLTCVADIFIVYRVYVVWTSSIIAAVVPALLAIADIVTGVLVLVGIRDLAAGDDPDNENLARRLNMFYGFTLGLNLLCSLMIAFRIWLAQRGASQIDTSNFSTATSIVVESAVIYSSALIATIVPTALGSNVQFCLLSVLPGVIGVAFSLIIIRVGSGVKPHTSPVGAMSALRFGGGGRQANTSTTMGTTTGTSHTAHSASEQQHRGVRAFWGGPKTHSRSTHTHTNTHAGIEHEHDLERDAGSEKSNSKGDVEKQV